VADLEDVRDRLAAISEELADAAMAALRDALEAGERARPEAERKLTQARRAVEKAVHALDALAASVAQENRAPS
jgi:hypothetical protein